MENSAIVIFINKQTKTGIDIEIPLNITANELIYGLNEAFQLGINIDDPEKCYLRMENPIGLLRGDTFLSDCGIRNGSKIIWEN